MSRYHNNRIVRKKNTRKKQLDTTTYPKIPKTTNDIFVLSQVGDRLDILAHQFYGTTELWWYIANANNIHTMNLEPGTSLRIPPLTHASKGINY